MTKRSTKANVIQMPKSKSPAISSESAESFILLAETENDREKRIDLYRKAVAAGNRALGKDWEKKFKGVCWMAHETRPVMHAMAQLAINLQWVEELREALTWYRKLMKLNPNDNQGIRYHLAGCLYEAGLDDELEKLLAANKDDESASLLYTKALHAFRKDGATNRSAKLLREAFAANNHVPIFLSDEVEMPDEPPSFIGFGDDQEAIAYVMDHGCLWGDTDGAEIWMAEILGPELRKAIDDTELVDVVLKALKGEYDD